MGIRWAKTIQWRTKVLELSIFPEHWNMLVLLHASPHLLPLLYQGLPSVNVSCSPELLISHVQVRIPPFPSLPSLSFPFPSLPLRKTEQVTLFPWLRTHTQHLPLQDFWPLLIVSTLRKEGERSDASPCIPAACFWELFWDTPCQHLVHFHPQSFKASRQELRIGESPRGNKQRWFMSSHSLEWVCVSPLGPTASQMGRYKSRDGLGNGRENYFPTARLTRTRGLDEVNSTHTTPISELGNWGLFCEIIPVRKGGCLPRKIGGYFCLFV